MGVVGNLHFLQALWQGHAINHNDAQGHEWRQR